MEILLAGLVSLFLAAAALAYCMDWLGLWMSKENLKNDIARSKVRMQGR